MDIGERKRKILHSIITEYIANAEPVGSRHIAKNLDLGLSSATIRNEMADLEDMGYLEQPHTSAGRVPSDKGYRFYVNELMSNYELTLKDLTMLKSLLEIRVGQLDKIIKSASVILSRITNYTAVLTTPEMKQGAIKTIELVPIDRTSMLIILVTNEGVMRNKRVMIPDNVESGFIYRFSNVLKEKLSGMLLEEINITKINEIKQAMETNFEMLFPVLDFITEIVDDVRQETEVYMSGATNIFNFPEYSDLDKAREFLEFLDDKQSIAEALKDTDTGGQTAHEEPQEASEGMEKNNHVEIRIGSENSLDIMRNSSIITANYYIGDKVMGKLGIIGPTRMDYSKTVAKIEQISTHLNKLLYELYYDDRE